MMLGKPRVVAAVERLHIDVIIGKGQSLESLKGGSATDLMLGP